MQEQPVVRVVPVSRRYGLHQLALDFVDGGSLGESQPATTVFADGGIMHSSPGL